jgi:hypothetical protein
MSDMKKITAEVSELIEAGKNKGQIEGYLKYTHDMSTNEAKEFAAKQFEANGYSSNMYGKADHKETVEYLRVHYGKLDKKALIEGMCEVNGKTYKTNQHAYNYIPMMLEWAKQEVAE